MRDSYFPFKLDADRSEVKPYHHHTAIKPNATILITWKLQFRSVTTQQHPTWDAEKGKWAEEE